MTEKRDEWETPKELFLALDDQYNFTFDCCANKINRKCVNFASIFQALDKDYLEDDMCWMNPPFSNAYNMFEHFFNVVKKGVAIYRCDNMETKVWQDLILVHATWILIPRGRICYKGFEGKGSRFPSALIGFNVDYPQIQGKRLLIMNR